MADPVDHADVLGFTTQIVVAHVSHNSIAAEALPSLINEVYRTLSGAHQASAPAERPEPAVPIKKSVFPDYIICLEDGKKFKSLKRHLRTQYDMTPEHYREKWGLPPDYPMVAPNYAVARSRLAKQMGLGQQRNGRR